MSAESVIDALTSDERYAITSPASDYYTSTNYFEKITGKVTDNRVSAVSVNDYRLKSYKPATGEWEYNANANHGNFDYGKNLFWVKYYDANDNEVHKQLFVIDRVRP